MCLSLNGLSSSSKSVRLSDWIKIQGIITSACKSPLKYKHTESSKDNHGEITITPTLPKKADVPILTIENAGFKAQSIFED